MAKITIDIGPTVAQLLGAEAVVNDIGVTVVDRGGPIALRAVSEILNTPAANPTVVVGIAKNGVFMAGATRTIIMQVSSRTSFSVEAFDPAAAVGDVYTLRASSTIPGAAHQITAGQTRFVVEALAQDAALCAGVGSATP
jgi:hypothetical protein